MSVGYIIMFISALIAVVLSYRIGFSMAMKIKEIKISEETEHESKIQRFIELLTDFVDEKTIKVSKPYHEEPEMVTTIDGKSKQKNTFF